MDKPNGFAATKASHLNTADLCAQQRITQQDPEIVAVNKIMDLGQQGEHTLGSKHSCFRLENLFL